MNVEEIRRLYWNDPFLPFELELDDGRTFTVLKPNYLTISPLGNRITFADVIENFEIIDLVEVKEYRLLEAAAQAG